MRDQDSNPWLTGIGCLLIFVIGTTHLIAGFIGIEHQFGWIGSTIAIALVIAGFGIPFTIGTFICCVSVWEWPWPLALLFTLPGLIFLLPSAMAAVFSVVPWSKFSRKNSGAPVFRQQRGTERSATVPISNDSEDALSLLGELPRTEIGKKQDFADIDSTTSSNPILFQDTIAPSPLILAFDIKKKFLPDNDDIVDAYESYEGGFPEKRNHLRQYIAYYMSDDRFYENFSRMALIKSYLYETALIYLSPPLPTWDDLGPKTKFVMCSLIDAAMNKDGSIKKQWRFQPEELIEHVRKTMHHNPYNSFDLLFSDDFAAILAANE